MARPKVEPWEPGYAETIRWLGLRQSAKCQWNDDGQASWIVFLPAPSAGYLIFTADEIRRERTGIHALVEIWHSATVASPNGLDTIWGRLTADTFNIGRMKERHELCRSACKRLSRDILEGYALDQMETDLADFLGELPASWVERQSVQSLYNVDDGPSILFHVLEPYIIDGGGTLLFAAPGSGKSYLALIMSVCVGAGTQSLWPVHKIPVLYVNLERSKESLERRMFYICQALGISGTDHNVGFLHARGRSLSQVAPQIKSIVGKSEYLLVVDSISRAGFGALVKDEVANEVVDTLNSLSRTWLGIGHAGRADQTHAFGSIMWDAGEDIGVQLNSEERDDCLGLSLQVVKVNEGSRRIPPAYLSLRFNESGELAQISKARVEQFPELAADRRLTNLQRIVKFVLDNEKATTSQVSANLGLDTATVSRFLSQSGRFVRLGREGKDVWYGVQVEERLMPLEEFKRKND